MTFIIGIYEKKDYFLASFDWQQLLSRERFFEFICITFLNVLGNLVVIWKMLDRKLLKMAFPQRIWLKQIRSKISSQWDFSRQKYNLPPLLPLKNAILRHFKIHADISGLWPKIIYHTYRGSYHSHFSNCK